jgi:GH25 family lysozyme M1 (1,4-beta-N-acetylmuramidase)
VSILEDDFEETHFDTNTRIGRWQTRSYVRDAIKEVKRLTGHAPIIYTGGPFWNQFGFKWNLGCPLWLAAYVPSDQLGRYVPKPWRAPSLWQFTDKHNSPGISQPCDWSVYLAGDVHHFRRTLTF